jgi:hypothetical protein
MIHPKPINKLDILDGKRYEPTARNFAVAAGLANLIVATMVFVEFSIISLVEHNPKTFQMGLWLVPFVTLVIWASTAVIYLLALAPRVIRALGRHLVGRPRSFPSARSGVWDDWLDRPEPHDR